MKGPALRKPWPVHAQIADHVQSGRTVLIEPGVRVRATFAVIHHPTLFEQPPAEHLGVVADHVILVMHHPFRDGEGRCGYRLDEIIDNIEATFGKKPLLAPVGPLVREQLPPRGYAGAALLAEDWHNLIDLADWPERKPGVHAPIHIGRHSRPHPPKWPDRLEDALGAYPERAGVKVSMLGGGEFLARLYQRVPAHWQLRPFGSQPVPEYLNELDFFVYFHSKKWIEAFGRSILEAMAVGLVCILPDHFRPLFGPAAIYAKPQEVGDLIDELTADPARYQLQSRRARTYIESHFGLDQFPARLERLQPGWRTPAKIQLERGPPPEKVAKTVMFMTSNGVGLGHLTRQMAIAEAMDDDFAPVFFTLSQGMRLVQEAGFEAEYRPFHRASGSDIARWNAALAEDLINSISFYDPQVFVFDGSLPYQGVITALAEFPRLKSIWVRRGLWAEHHANGLERAASFDGMIEPLDLARAFDHGPTRSTDDGAYLVPPIVRLTRMPKLGRAAARKALGLRADGMAVAIALGSGANFDMSPVRDAVLRELLARRNIQPVEILSPIAPAQAAYIPGVLQVRQYPLLPFMAAFDAMVCACGYNAFHEAMLERMPTIFVPNEADEMDLQLTRARYGEVAGASLTLRRADLNSVSRLFDKLLDNDYREHMAGRAGTLWKGNGAKDAARYISDYAYLRKTLPSLRGAIAGAEDDHDTAKLG